MNRVAVLSLALILIVAAHAEPQQSVLSHQFARDAEHPLAWNAGQTLGSFVYRMAQAAQTPVVLELEEEPVTPRRGMDLAGKTLGEALALLVTTDPRYSWREVGGVIVIRPLKAWTDTGNPLNARVDSVRWNNVTLGTATNRMLALIYGYPVVPDEPIEGARSFSVAVASGSVLDVLVVSARAHGSVMWSTPYTFTRPHQKWTKFSLGYRSLNMSEDLGHRVAWSLPMLPPLTR
jgi:hypothetical protein